MKTKTFLLLISLSIFATFQQHAQTPGFEWAGQIGGDSLFWVTSVAVDAAGDQVYTGYFKETADFNPDPDITFNLTSNGLLDIFILKLDVNGDFLWAAKIGDSRNDYGLEVTTDAMGNIYAIGYFWGTTDVDPGEGEYFLSQDRYTTMVLKIEPDGDLIWGKQMGSETAGHAYGHAIAVDNSGNVFTSGQFYGRVDFDPGPAVYNLTCTSNDIFIQKLDQNGNFLWVKQLVGADAKIAYSMATDPGGNIYLGGYFMGTIDFNPDKKLKYNLTASGDYDIFVMNLTGTGDFGWAKKVGGTAQDLCYSIALDPAGYLYATGHFYGTVDFNPGSGAFNLTSFGGNDAYVLKLDLSGNFVWANQIGGPSYDSGGDIILDGEGYYYVSGYFYYTSDFDPGAGTYYLTSSGHDDSYVLKSDIDGNFQWVIQAGGPGWDYSLSLAVDNAGNIINVGSFEETAEFDPGGNGVFEMTNVNIRDIFIQKLNPSGGDVCPVPTGLTVTNITETTADLSWNVVTGALTYDVRYRQIDSNWVVVTGIDGTTLALSDLVTAGSYEFQVRTNCLSNYSYSVEFLTPGSGCPDIYEPNETMQTAVLIPVNIDITALISSNTDVDWFKFSTSGSARNVMITLTNLPADYNIKLYSASGTLLGTSDIMGLGDETIIYNSAKVGTYYIHVYPRSDSYDPFNCYTLRAATSSTSFSKSVEADVINSLESTVLSIYPNPAREILNIDFSSTVEGTAKMTLMNTGGQTVMQNEFRVAEGANHFMVKVGELKPGLYLVRISTNNAVFNRKIMITN